MKNQNEIERVLAYQTAKIISTPNLEKISGGRANIITGGPTGTPDKQDFWRDL